MATELIAGLGLFKSMFDMAKGLKDINSATVRNGAIIELQEHILSAREQQTALTERISELEKEVADFETWEAEKQRYKLKDYGGGTFAYALKEAEANGGTLHRACANCYQNRQISILQSRGIRHGGQEKVICLACKTTLMLGVFRDPEGH